MDKNGIKKSGQAQLSSHFVIIIDLNTICGMVYDICGIKLLDIKIMPVKVDAH